MNRDYYNILGISRNADETEIKRAYRKMAQKYHPDKTGSSPEATEKFKAVSEAYQVLSVPERKGVYDQFGEEGLKGGMPTGGPGENVGGHYTNFKDPFELFRQFFGTEAPTDMRRSNLLATDADNTADRFHEQPQPTQPPAVQRDLVCTLEELYHGTTKRLRITRQRYSASRTSLAPSEKMVTIDVKPGWKPGTVITFKGEGDEGPGIVPSDVVFTVREAPHDRFRRQGADLVFPVTVPLVDALNGCRVAVETLDGRILSIPVTAVVASGYCHRVTGEGMPISKQPGKRGDLLLEFAVTFPQYLDPEQKGLIAKALSG